MNTLTNPITHLKHCIVDYRKTDSFSSEKIIKELTYAEGLSMTIHEVANSIELKAIDSIPDTVRALIEIEENKTDLMLSKADGIYVRKGGKLILKIENTKPPNTGYSLYVVLCAEKKKPKYSWLNTSFMLSIGLLVYAVATLLRHTNKTN